MEVLIVDDNTEMRARLRQEVASMDVIERVTTATSSVEGISAVEKRRPSLLVCDPGLADGDGMNVIRRAAELNVPSLVVSGLLDEETVFSAVESGARGYLLKDNITLFKSAVEDVLRGNSPVEPSVARCIIDRVRKKQKTKSKPNLTDELSGREAEVLKLLASGKTIVEVACVLNISKHTVTNHNRSVYKKLNVNSRSKAVYLAMQCGIV